MPCTMKVLLLAIFLLSSTLCVSAHHSGNPNVSPDVAHTVFDILGQFFTNLLRTYLVLIRKILNIFKHNAPPPPPHPTETTLESTTEVQTVNSPNTTSSSLSSSDTTSSETTSESTPETTSEAFNYTVPPLNASCIPSFNYTLYCREGYYFYLQCAADNQSFIVMEIYGGCPIVCNPEDTILIACAENLFVYLACNETRSDWSLLRSDSCPYYVSTTIEPTSATNPISCYGSWVDIDYSDETKYYQCINSTYLLKQCPNEETFNLNQLTCGDKCIEGLTKDAPDPKPSPNTEYLVCISGTWQQQTCPQRTIYVYYEPNCVNYTCYPGDTQASPLDDTKYLECDGTEWIEKSCPTGNRYNRYWSECQSIVCQPGMKNDSIVFWDAVYLDCDTLKVCPNQDKFWSSLNQCYGSNETAIVPFNSSCGISTPVYSSYWNTYFECDNGVWDLKTCALNEIFYATQYGSYCTSAEPCSYGDTKELTSVPSNLPEINTNGTFYLFCYGYWLIEACPSGEIFDKNMKTCATSLSSNVTNCTSGSLKGFQNANITNAYYLCVDGTWVTQTCPPDTIIYNGSTDCIQVTTVSDAETTAAAYYCYSHMIDLFISDSTKYFECINSSYILKQCPSEGIFNLNDLTCGGVCIEGLTKDIPDPKPYPSNQYLLCEEEKWVPETCPSGTIYIYYETQYCVEYSCYPEDRQAVPLDDTKYLECNGTGWTEQSCPTGERFNRYYLECQSTKCIDGMKNDSFKFWDSMYLNCGVLTPCPNLDKFWSSRNQCYGSNESAIVEDSSCGGITTPLYANYWNTYFECDQESWVLKFCPIDKIFFETKLGSYCVDNQTCPYGANKPLLALPDDLTDVTANGTFYYHCYGYWLIDACHPGEVFDKGLMDCTSTPNDYSNGKVCTEGSKMVISDSYYSKFSYYECLNGSAWISSTCPLGEEFSEASLNCIPSNNTYFANSNFKSLL